MARPLRLEFAGALYHVTSRGDRREAIYRADADREHWLEVLGNVCDRFNWVVHAYCQMTNHYHVLVETIDGNLSLGMRQLNGRYNQWIQTTLLRFEYLILSKPQEGCECRGGDVINGLCASVEREGG